MRKTSCSYNWGKIEILLKKIKEVDKNNFTIAIFHTHPNLFGEKYGTLFEKHEEKYKELGIQPNGLNISLADIYANMYLDMLLKKYCLPQVAESIILMHDGRVVSFNTKNGINLTGNDTLEKISNQTFKKEKPKMEDLTL